MPKMSLSYCLCLTALLTLGGCEGTASNDANGSTKRDLAALLAAPTQTTVSGKPLTLQTFLWRDFMPIAPPDGKGLIALISIVTVDLSEIPAGLNADRLWVIHGEDVWETGFSEEDRPVYESKLEFIARGGPKWAPGDTVELVVRLQADSSEVYLRASGVPINRTD